MASFHPVRITLVERTKKCHNGHQVGDQWQVGHLTPEGLCLGAFSSLLPYIHVLQYGGDFSWVDEPGSVIIACPDHKVRCVYRVERVAD